EAHDSGVGSGPADDSERAPDDDPADGRLILVGTPIGNLGDASPRMRQTIEAADVIAAEDTRRVLSLAQRLELRPTNRVISVFDPNEGHCAPALGRTIAAGESEAMALGSGRP